jgi:hypothetical protein
MTTVLENVVNLIAEKAPAKGMELVFTEQGESDIVIRLREESDKEVTARCRIRRGVDLKRSSSLG